MKLESMDKKKGEGRRPARMLFLIPLLLVLAMAAAGVKLYELEK